MLIDVLNCAALRRWLGALAPHTRRHPKPYSIAMILLDLDEALEVGDDFGYHHARTHLLEADRQRCVRGIPSVFS